MANFVAPEALLKPRLPTGVEIDQYEGRAWVSVVALEFANTRVIGVPWPGCRRFSEVNLRFYARHGSQRGVVFVREYVPHRLIAGIARCVYCESFEAVQMQCASRETADSLELEHALTIGGRRNALRVSADKPPRRPVGNSLEQFFTQRQWGYGKSRRGHTVRYQVRHPAWECYALRAYSLDFDWALLFGPEWSGYSGAQPESAVLAAGSAVEIYPKGRLPAPSGPQAVVQPLALPLPG
jgi:hypothetical protein